MKRRILLFFVSPWSALDASTRKIQSALVYRVGLRCGRGRNDLEIGLRSMPQNRRITMSEPAKPAAWRPLGQQYHTNNREPTHRNGVTDHCRLVLATYHCLSYNNNNNFLLLPVPSCVPVDRSQQHAVFETHRPVLRLRHRLSNPCVEA